VAPIIELSSLQKPSFSSIAKILANPDLPNDIAMLANALRKIAGIKPPFTSTKAETNHKMCRVHVQGVQKYSIKNIKASLLNQDFNSPRFGPLILLAK
jgi:hypothetical protein